MTLSLVEAANELCEGRIVSALEGGYSESGLKGGVFAQLRIFFFFLQKTENLFTASLDCYIYLLAAKDLHEFVDPPKENDGAPRVTTRSFEKKN